MSKEKLMKKMQATPLERKVWRRAEECDAACGAFTDAQLLTCEQQHKLCENCDQVLLFGSHQSVSQAGTAWKIEPSNHHLTSDKETDKWQVTCLRCVRESEEN